MSSTISRVLYQMIIYLGLMLPLDSSDLPKSTTGRRNAFYSVLLRMGFTWSLAVTNKAVSSYFTFPPLPQSAQDVAVYFCCTFLRVASTGRYPASCPMKPGLSSPKPFRFIPTDCQQADGIFRCDHLCYSSNFILT